MEKLVPFLNWSTKTPQGALTFILCYIYYYCIISTVYHTVAYESFSQKLSDNIIHEEKTKEINV